MPESNLEDLKKEYKKLQKKYNLPNFDYINQNFEIENMAEVETDLLLKK